MPANLSGPIPTSRGKKTFDKRPDIPAVGPGWVSPEPGQVVILLERDEWILDEVRRRRC